MERPLRVHLGSGHYCWPGFVNIDCVGEPDIKADVTDLSMLDDESVDEIHAIHLFEHLDRMKADSALKEWLRVLKPGGKLVLELPCLDKIAQMLVGGEKNLRLTLFGIFGDVRDESPYMRHLWCYTEAELKGLLESVGFEVTSEPPVFHIEKRDMRLIGVKV